MRLPPMTPAFSQCAAPIPNACSSFMPRGDTRSAVYFGAALGAAARSSFVLQSVAQEQSTDLDPIPLRFRGAVGQRGVAIDL